MAPSWFQVVVVSAAAAAGVALLLPAAWRRAVRQLQDQLDSTKMQLEAELCERQSERAGRIRAETALRQARVEMAAAAGASSPFSADGGGGGGRTSDAAPSSFECYPFVPLGRLHSCFSQRNGTPRQPLLVPAARAVLTLRPELPPTLLEGLEQYSHVWVLYVFHANTNLHKCLGKQGQKAAGVKGKIEVPRLGLGGRMGVLATRSPHRPVPIGLSVARVEGVSGRTLLLRGADLVDGSPVLDIKPYVPFCDSLQDARCPAWVGAHVDGEPLAICEVVLGQQATEQLQRAWEQAPHSLYSDFGGFRELVCQVLSRDIRSAHHRQSGKHAKPAAVRAEGNSAHTSGKEQQQGPGEQGKLGVAVAASGSGITVQQGVEGGDQGFYHVILDGVDVSYDVTTDNMVLVRTAALASSTTDAELK